MFLDEISKFTPDAALSGKDETERLAARVRHLEKVVAYLEYNLSRTMAITRHLAAPIINDLPLAKQTRESFNFQWGSVPTGRFSLGNKDFRKEAPGYVCQFTALPPEWFPGKKAVDVGCGRGRYSWAMSKLGAQVLSLDQSEHGLAHTAEECKEFPGHRTQKINLLESLNIGETFDLVWSFGVLHHTGDTYGAYKKIVPLVKPGGYLFLMLYGEPNRGKIQEYDAVNEYEYWRKHTRNMDMERRLAAVTKAMEDRKFAIYGKEFIEGYFDAISPLINDLYTQEEVEAWLISDGFTDIKRTSDNRNLHLIARKV